MNKGGRGGVPIEDYSEVVVYRPQQFILGKRVEGSVSQRAKTRYKT